MYAGSTESFGKQWGPGDVVGVFLDLVDHTISKALTRMTFVIGFAVNNFVSFSN